MRIYTSPYTCTLPDTDILSWIFPEGKPISTDSLWHNAANPSTSLSPTDLRKEISRMAIMFRNQGLQPGDVVMVMSPNHIYMPIAYFGCIGSEIIFSGANPIYTPREIGQQLKVTGAKLFLVHPDCFEVAYEAAIETKFPTDRLFLFSDSRQSSRKGVADWFTKLPDADQEDVKIWKWRKLTPEEASKTVAALNFSSGTTGLPKGVRITHRNLLSNAAQVIHMKGVGTPDGSPTVKNERWLGFLPLYHAYGQMYTMILAVKLSVPIFVISKFQLSELLGYIEKYRITHLHAVPPILVLLEKSPETRKHDLSSVKQILCGAAPLSKELQNKVSKLLGGGKCQVKQGWGMTETTCAGTHVPGGLEDKDGSVGVLLPGLEARLVDEKNQDVPVGGKGEILLRGPNITIGYWRNLKATQEAIDNDGWLRTGDVAVTDKKGQFWIVDRKKELIKVSGFQVAPAELEAVLIENEHINDAAVVGLTMGTKEVPRAYIVLKPGASISAKDINQWFQSRVSRHKWLDGGILFIDVVPKSASGKINRQILKSWAARDANGQKGKL